MSPYVTAGRVCHICCHTQYNRAVSVCLSLSSSTWKKMSTKRKSDASTAASKKARTSAHAPVKALVTTILANINTYPISNNESETRDTIVHLAQYTRSLEEELAGGGGRGAGPSKPTLKTMEQLEEAAQKIEKAARSGIRKQMTVRLFFC
jgi:hypothetical protein